MSAITDFLFAVLVGFSVIAGVAMIGLLFAFACGAIRHATNTQLGKIVAATLLCALTGYVVILWGERLGFL